MKFSFYKLRLKAEKFWLIVLIGVIVVSLNAIVSTGTNLLQIKSTLETTLFKKQHLINTVEKLVPGTDISYYINKFGQPLFINVGDKTEKKEWVFVNEFFYLDVVTDLDNQVVYFAVTTRDKTFNPTFRTAGYPNNSPSFKVTLGSTRFSDLPTTPEQISGCVGARRFFYHELHYLGNPGHYKTYGVGINDAGILSEEDAIWDFLIENSEYCTFVNERSPSLENESFLTARKNSIINTYFETAPLVSISSMSAQIFVGPSIGVDLDQVRILKE